MARPLAVEAPLLAVVALPLAVEPAAVESDSTDK